MILFENVFFSYDKKTPVLSGFSLEINETDRICLFGPSGQGKTTILRMALGLLKPDTGRVVIENGAAPSAVFQEDRLIPWKTVFENTALFAENERKAKEILTALGLESVLNAPPQELSGGMKRRVALARSLCHRFDYLILDEPFTGLDDETKKICIDLIHQELAGRPLLLSTHDAAEAAALEARIVNLS